MLPNLHSQHYQEFAKILGHLQYHVTATEPNLPSLRQSFLEVQQFFQQQIIGLDSDDLDAVIAARVQSYQTETSKQLRLLGIDLTFWQGSRQPETARDRKIQLERRVETLISYGNAILQLTTQEQGSPEQ